MPYVSIRITKTGVTRDHKRQLVEEVTASLNRILGKRPEHTHVVIDLVDEEDWGYAGMLTDDWRKAQRVNARAAKTSRKQRASK